MDNEKLDHIWFFPSLWSQRARFSNLILEGAQCRTILDLGCGEGAVLRKFIHTKIGIDLCLNSLVRAKINLTPESYEVRRETPLSIELLRGNILHPPKEYHTRGDLGVSVMEVVEHLLPDDSITLAHAIFSTITPRLCVVSTPNIEFNALFNKKDTKRLRNPDHKFEWNRKEFKEWCDMICAEINTDYSVIYVGLGEPPPETESNALSLTEEGEHDSINNECQRHPGMFLRWFEEGGFPKLVIPFPPLDCNTKGRNICHNITVNNDQSEVSPHLIPHRIEVQSKTPVFSVFGIPVITYICKDVRGLSREDLRQEWYMYTQYGPCTQAAIFFKTELFLKELLEMERSELPKDVKSNMLSWSTTPKESYHISLEDHNMDSGSEEWSIFEKLRWPSIKDRDFNINISMGTEMQKVRNSLLEMKQRGQKAVQYAPLAVDDVIGWAESQTLKITLNEIWNDFPNSENIRRLCEEQKRIFENVIKENKNDWNMKLHSNDEIEIVLPPLERQKRRSDLSVEKFSHEENNSENDDGYNNPDGLRTVEQLLLNQMNASNDSNDESEISNRWKNGSNIGWVIEPSNDGSCSDLDNSHSWNYPFNNNNALNVDKYW